MNAPHHGFATELGEAQASPVFLVTPQRITDALRRIHDAPSCNCDAPTAEPSYTDRSVTDWIKTKQIDRNWVPVALLAARVAVDFDKGHIYWTDGERAGMRAFATLAHNGYLMGQFPYQGRQNALYAHRIVWGIAHGDWPQRIDHINGDRTDNRLCNLRDVSHRENMRNRKVHVNSQLGEVGISQMKDGRFRVRAPVRNGRTTHIGMYDTLAEAFAARSAAYRILGYHPNHGKRS